MLAETETTKAIDQSKVCKNCGEKKPLAEFSGCGITPDRLQPNCKPCHNERRQAGLIASWKRLADQEVDYSIQRPATSGINHAAAYRAREMPSLEAIPYPEYKDFQADDEMRDFSKTMANHATLILILNPKHPRREDILLKIKEYSYIADMDDEQFREYELAQDKRANGLSTGNLSRDEKIQLIRTLPIHIVKKMFPRL